MVDCVVVGAGPAGLAASSALADREVDHVVLERGRVGQTWRTQRWDSLRLNNPGRFNLMLGPQPPDTYLTAAEVCERLEALAARLPVREDAPVTRLVRSGSGWTLHGPSAAAVRSRAVIVATGGENVPVTPALDRHLPVGLTRLHAAEYRSPARLPPGPVLVVGSGQSGYQISEELLAAGRFVIVATSTVGRAPARHRGSDVLTRLLESGFFDQRPADLPDPSVVHAPQPLLAPGGRSAGLRILARSGAVLAGRLVAVDGHLLRFDDSAAANVAAADAFAARIRALLDDLLRREGRPLPPDEPDPADAPVPLRPPATLDACTLACVVWCTGYTGDFGWLGPDLLDRTGRPLRDGVRIRAAGMYAVGL